MRASERRAVRVAHATAGLDIALFAESDLRADDLFTQVAPFTLRRFRA